jgi:hypothetical protein
MLRSGSRSPSVALPGNLTLGKVILQTIGLSLAFTIGADIMLGGFVMLAQGYTRLFLWFNVIFFTLLLIRSPFVIIGVEREFSEGLPCPQCAQSIEGIGNRKIEGRRIGMRMEANSQNDWIYTCPECGYCCVRYYFSEP